MLKVNISNTWKNIKYGYVNVNNTWRKIKNIYTNVNGVWKPLWSYSWYTGNWSNCSAECGGGTQTRTVYCKRNDNVQVDDNFCSGTKPISSQSCNTQSCVDCQYIMDGSIPKKAWVIRRTGGGTGAGNQAYENSLYWDICIVWSIGKSKYPSETLQITSYSSGGYLYTRGTDYGQNGTWYRRFAICRQIV